MGCKFSGSDSKQDDLVNITLCYTMISKSNYRTTKRLKNDVTKRTRINVLYLELYT